jgi:hypothetical protein
MAAYGILDAAKAVVAGVPGLADKVLIGQAQGGAGAFAAGAYAATYAPQLGVKGSIGWCDYTVGSKNVGEQDQNKVDPALAYGFYTLLAAQQYDPSIDPRDFYTDKALPLFEQAPHQLPVSAGQRRGRHRPDPGQRQRRTTRATSSSPWLAQVSYPTLKLAQPIFIGTGAEDKTPAAATQVRADAGRLQGRLGGAGPPVQGPGPQRNGECLAEGLHPLRPPGHQRPAGHPNCSPSVQ